MMSDAIEPLRLRFDALMGRLCTTPGVWNFGLLAARYAEAHRSYHDLDHIVRCLTDFERVRHMAVSPDEVEAAIFFHDAIYESNANDNEERSAVLAIESLTAAGVDTAIGNRVADLIRATTHKEVPQDPDAKLLVDVDLAGLAEPYEDFLETGRRVREEFPHVSDADFAEGRREFFRAFLSRRSIYATEHFRELHEAAARDNLRRLVEG